jgi:hypothetical protein
MTYSCNSSFTTMSSMRTSSSSRSDYFGPDPFFDFSGIHCDGFDDDKSFLGSCGDDTSEHVNMDYEPSLTLRLEAVKKKKKFSERLVVMKSWVRRVLGCQV